MCLDGSVSVSVALGTALPGVAARGVGGVGGAQHEQRQQRPRHRHPVGTLTPIRQVDRENATRHRRHLKLARSA